MLTGDELIEKDRTLAKQLAHDKTGQLRVGINLLAGQVRQYGHRLIARSSPMTINLTIVLNRGAESTGETPPSPSPARKGRREA